MIYQNGVYTIPFFFYAHGSTGEIIRFELYSSISYQDDNMLLYRGPYYSLNYNYGEWYSAPLNVRMNAEYAYADLYVYDCAGNSSHDRIDILHDVRD